MRPIKPAIAGLLLVAPIGALCAFGGDSSSTVSTPTTNVDARVVGGDLSSNASINNNSGPVNLMTTDHGAVDGGLRLALAGVEGAQRIASETVAANGTLLSGALKMAGDQQQGFTDTVSAIKTSDVRVLVIAGLAVVGLASVKLLKKA